MSWIQDRLIAWGRGQQINRAPNGYPPMSPGARLIRNPDSATVSLPPLDEDEHEAVEAAVRQLRQNKQVHYKVIYQAYVRGRRDATTAKVLRMSRSSVRNIRENAEHYLEALLDAATGP